MDAVHHQAQEARAVFKAAAKITGTGVGAQQLVPEVAVAVLDVNELESCLSGQGCSRHELPGKGFQLAVADDWVIVWDTKFAIQVRVMVSDYRFQLILAIGTRKTPGMRELQADQQVIAFLESLDVFLNKCLAQNNESRQVGFDDHELVRIGTPVRADSCGFTAPDELGAALAKVPPAPKGVLAWQPIGSAIPAFHGVSAEAVADAEAILKCVWLCQRGSLAVLKNLIEG